MLACRCGETHRRAMKKLILMLATACITQPLGAQSPETQRQLIAARDTIWRAYFSNDTALLRRFLPQAAASFEGGENGRWNDRAQITNSAREFVRSKGRLLDLRFTNTQISQTGNSALVRSNFRTITQSGARVDTASGRATELFVRVRNTWVNPYWQLEPGVNVAREIPLPDTLGANFAIGDSAAGKGTLNDYDALLGTWEFSYQDRADDGSYQTPFKGHWTFEKKPGGGLIEDRWRPDDPTAPLAKSLYTYRTFDPKRKVWVIIGTQSSGGKMDPGLTWTDENNRYVIQVAGNGISRIRYLAIDANHFLWRSDWSGDGGKTWILDTGLMEARRISR